MKMSLRTHNTWDKNAIYSFLKENRKIHTYRYLNIYTHKYIHTDYPPK